MGHGCYYTNYETGTKAFWIELDPYYTDEETGEQRFDSFVWQDTIDNLSSELEVFGYSKIDQYTFENGLYKLVLESGHGDEIVFRLEPRYTEVWATEDVRVYNLAIGNHNRCYTSLAKKLCKRGYELRMASSGYTSGVFKPC